MGEGQIPFPAVEIGEVDYKTKVKTASSLDHRRAVEAAPEVTWMWKRESLQGFVATVSLYYRKKVFKDIRLVLTAVGGKKLLQQFSDGCFGHLMHFIGGPNSIKALHELISHEIILPGAREDELWFHIGGTNIRFSPAEYALVTGLRFGSCSFDPLGSHEIPSDGVYMQFCSGHPITIKKLWKRFKSHRVRGSAEDYLKVAHILALHLMVLGPDQRRIVGKWVWVLVEDLELWNRFPWGAYAYQALMHYVSILPKTRADRGLKLKYHFYGPVWALQMWAYEAIPELGNTCALITGQVTVPRCLKWSFRSIKRMEIAHIFEQKPVCFVTLDPTDEEKLQPYWVSVQTPESLDVRYTPSQRFVGAGNRAKALLSSDDRVSSQQSRPSSAEHVDTDEDSDSDDSALMPSAHPKCTRESTDLSLSSGDKIDRPQHVPQVFDEAGFVDRVSDRVVDRLIEPVVERLSQQLIPQLKQLIEDLSRQSRQSPSQHSSREVHDQLEMMHDTSFLRANPKFLESAKAAERKKEQSYDWGLSSMNFSTKTDNGCSLGEKKKPAPKDAFGGEEQLEGLGNAPRLDTGVSGGAKSSGNQKDAIDEDQIGSVECLKGELKRKRRTCPHRGGGAAYISKKKNKKKKKPSRSKQMRRSPSSSEDEGSKSSWGNERRRKLKKRSKKKKKKRKHSESSLSESSSDSDKRRRKRKRRSYRRSSSSEASYSVSSSD